MNFSEVVRIMKERGYIDERKALVFGVMDSPLGEFSCIAAIKGNTLRIFLSDASMKIGVMRHEFGIRSLKVTKISSFFLAPKIKFDYQNKHYTLSRFGSPKEFITVFQNENK